MMLEVSHLGGYIQNGPESGMEHFASETLLALFAGDCGVHQGFTVCHLLPGALLGLILWYCSD